MTALQYAHDHRAAFLDELKTLLRIPSISTDPDRRADILRAAEWLADDLRRIGLQNVQLLPTGGHPALYAEWLGAGPNAPTVLVYGHYDVQPAAMADGWTSDPFEPVERAGRLVARGSSDDKGQVFTHVKAWQALLAEGSAPVNVKFLIEGEEEIGSANLPALVRDRAALLKADVCVISDTGMKLETQPVISYSTRGLVYLDYEIQGPKQDLHSGGYGGIVHNPAQVLAEVIAQLHDANGQVLVPGFYDDVVPLSTEERAALNQSAPSEDDWRRETGVSQFWGEPDYALHERIGARPTLEINGMVSGFYGEGSKTVLPARALAKMSCRLVANQDPHQIYELVKAHLLRLTPPTVRAVVRPQAHAAPAMMDIHAPAMQAAVRAYERGWGQRPVFSRGGGTLPILAEFQQHLGGLPIILMGFGLNGDGAHGPDESYSIGMFFKGIDTAICFYEELGSGKG